MFMRLIKALLVIVIVLSAFFLGSYFGSKTVYIMQNYTTPQGADATLMPYVMDETEMSLASINVPAVDQEGNGVATTLSVQVFPGLGRALTNIDKLLFWVDTQNSIRTAKYVAENVTGKDLSEYDIVYTIKANASVIGGGSAGAALTIATIAALEGKEINENVMITGTINHDGTIGPVGEILAKATAAKFLGVETFLVPLGQSSQITYESKRHCEKIGAMDFCTIETVPKKINVSEQVGIEIKEVYNINEAIEYLLKD